MQRCRNPAVRCQQHVPCPGLQTEPSWPSETSDAMSRRQSSCASPGSSLHRPATASPIPAFAWRNQRKDMQGGRSVKLDYGKREPPGRDGTRQAQQQQVDGSRRRSSISTYLHGWWQGLHTHACIQSLLCRPCPLVCFLTQPPCLYLSPTGGTCTRRTTTRPAWPSNKLRHSSHARIVCLCDRAFMILWRCLWCTRCRRPSPGRGRLCSPSSPTTITGGRWRQSNRPPTRS